ncbi:MAG: inositol-3-phosphate synthase [Candidatus Auribacterota bacterium]|jgi:myo-inositol-1-phosphate synthase|nr:inositol-3-phosphate synthase [Candidatus Auribacterota bacterium]
MNGISHTPQSNKPENRRIGVWLIGGYGIVASCTIIGALSLRRPSSATTGLITELPLFEGIPLLPWDTLLFGGMDIRRQSIGATLKELHTHARVLPCGIWDDFADELTEIERKIIPGIFSQQNDAVRSIMDPSFIFEGSLKECVSYIKQSLDDFKTRNRLDDVIVVNLSSTEPFVNIDSHLTSYDGIRQAIDSNIANPYPASVLYAWASIDAGYPYINFTPSQGAHLEGIQKLAMERKIPHAGNDGKTGETLLKSVLAPMFLRKNLEVLSWEGYNILGNTDGLILEDPKNKATKIRSKGRTLDAILGYSPHSKVTIDMVPSLSDWKIAWDFIHFNGFLNTPMTMQFIWNGCDSLLAAPLVLDLVRLVEFAHRKCEYGIQTQLSCFFKDPLGCQQLDFIRQYDMLENYVHHMKGS